MQFGIDMWAGPGAFFWGGSLCICLPDYDIFCPEREHENMLESGHVVIDGIGICIGTCLSSGVM